jgi:hypothetical protein
MYSTATSFTQFFTGFYWAQICSQAENFDDDSNTNPRDKYHKADEGLEHLVIDSIQKLRDFVNERFRLKFIKRIATTIPLSVKISSTIW